jgi:hypothetical protein
MIKAENRSTAHADEDELKDTKLDGADPTGARGWKQAQFDAAQTTQRTILPVGAAKLGIQEMFVDPFQCGQLNGKPESANKYVRAAHGHCRRARAGLISVISATIALLRSV